MSHLFDTDIEILSFLLMCALFVWLVINLMVSEIGRFVTVAGFMSNEIDATDAMQLRKL